MNNILIIGGDGVIGKALTTILDKSGFCVSCTTRRVDTINNRRLFLDLSKNLDSFIIPKNIDTAIICAFITKLEDCIRDKKISYIVNVENTIKLYKKLIKHNIFTVYLSTNQVFDGTVPFQHPDAPYSPMTEYGRQKVELEKELKKNIKMNSILRISKVIYPNYGLFKNWISSLSNGEIINPFFNMFFAPIPLSFMTKVIVEIIIRRINGIVQVSGNKDISYSDIAFYMAHKLGFKCTLIKPIDAVENGYIGTLPKNTTLNSDILNQKLELTIPDIKTVTMETILL